MRFTVVSHACMYVEHGDTSLMVDPWLVGSAYWRSWWNFPEPRRDIVDSLAPKNIYITHLHWDHFHGPSLRLFPRDTRVLVPKLPTTRRMVEDLAYNGFENVVEIPHGGRVDLGDGLELHSFQAGPGSDSSIVVTDGETTLLDANDCKLFGQTLKQITHRFPKIDFCFRSHSSAGPVPYCIVDYERDFQDFRPPEHYAEEFAAFAVDVGARYAIPFASNHCYLHRETVQFNRLISSPKDAAIRTHALAARAGSQTEAVVMAPGSRWSRDDGFELVDFDYDDAPAYVALLSEKYRDKLEATYRQEEITGPDEEAFVRYFEPLMAAIPRPVARRLMGPIAFDVGAEDKPEYWTLDFETGHIRTGGRTDAPPPVVIRTPARVLNDCTTIRMFSTWSASKRLSIRLAEPKRLRSANALFLFLDLFELGGIPAHRNFAPRSLGARLRRWREPIDMVDFVRRRGRAAGPSRDVGGGRELSNSRGESPAG